MQGDVFKYTVTVQNRKGATQTITVEDNLPTENLIYLESTPPGEYDDQNNKVTWTFENMNPGQLQIITIRVQADWDAPDETVHSGER